jgi:membrane fusion protein (multidrug efflux system)
VASGAAFDGARTTLEMASSRVRAAQARLGVAERALRDADVKAAFAGLIAKRHVSRGEFVRPGTPLVELVATDPVEVEFHLSEVDSQRVAKGQRVEVRVAPLPDEVFEARVTMVAPTIDSSTRTLRVKAQLDNAGGRLRPGLFARVDLGIAQRSGVILVPETAVLQRARGPIVYVLTDGDRVERRSVETGVHRDGAIEIASGLAPGDSVVVLGNVRLVDGAAVRTRIYGQRGQQSRDAEKASEVAGARP